MPTNTTSDGTAFAVTTRSSAVAFENVSQGGGHYPSTGVIVIYEVADNNR